MAINIKNPAVVARIRRLARERDVDLTEAIRLAVEHELDRSARRRAARRRRAERIIDRVAGYPSGDFRTDDEILGYGEDGLPK